MREINTIRSAGSQAVRIDQDLHRRLSDYCARTGRSMRWVADRAIKQIMAEIEADELQQGGKNAI